eukprot:Em0014g755a
MVAKSSDKTHTAVKRAPRLTEERPQSGWPRDGNHGEDTDDSHQVRDYHLKDQGELPPSELLVPQYHEDEEAVQTQPEHEVKTEFII